MDYYKKIDKSFFRYGVIIPNKYVDAFLGGKSIRPGTQRKITIRWKGKKKGYDAVLRHSRKTSGQKYYGIRWLNNELILDLKKEFVQSYVAVESKDFQSKKEGKYYKTDLLGGNQEVLIVRPINPDLVEFETFIKIKTLYDNVFKRLVEQNIFDWLSKPDVDQLVIKSTKWFDIKDLKDHEPELGVVYYLLDEEKKEIYIGKAMRLGDRVTKGRPEIPGWTKFRYDIIHPDYRFLLPRLEAHTIRAFAGFFKNNGHTRHYPVSDFMLVNKSWPKRK